MKQSDEGSHERLDAKPIQITQSPIHEVPRRQRNKNSEESHPYLTVPVSYMDYFDKTDAEMKCRWNTAAGEQSGTCTTQGQAHPHIIWANLV